MAFDSILFAKTGQKGQVSDVPQSNLNIHYLEPEDHPPGTLVARTNLGHGLVNFRITARNPSDISDNAHD